MDHHRLSEALHVKCPSALTTACWFPGASVANPVMYALLSACRDQPVNLLDGQTGKVCDFATAF